MVPELKVRAMRSEDLSQAAEVHRHAFARQTLSYEWLECTWRAFPRTCCYVATIEEVVRGYIVWVQKSGFRADVIAELEQIAVDPSFQGQGIGTSLITLSLQKVRNQLSERGAQLKHIMVTTRADNHAQALYKKTLEAEVEATITNLYSADEVIMIARNI